VRSRATLQYAAREVLRGKDARTLARELLGMTQPEFSAAFKGSPMRRAKLRGLMWSDTRTSVSSGSRSGA
jgi:hypothetical protein